MTRTQYFVAASLDGYLSETDGNIGWLLAFGNPAEETETAEGSLYERFYEGVGALAIGADTYVQVIEELQMDWPYGDKPTWVFTHRELEPPPGSAVTFTDRPPTEVHPDLVAAAGDRHVWVVGGRTLVDQFAAAGLIDDLRVTMVPVLLGDGIPFISHRHTEPLRLTGTDALPSGMVELRYALD